MYPNSYRTASSMNTFNNQLSLYIPRVTPEWADADRMIAKFAELEVGVVRRIDFVEKVSDNGYTYHQAFVHFESWNDCQTTRNMQERIADPNRQCRLVYDDPWYWMLLKNKNPLSDTEYRLEQRIIDLEQRLDQNDQLFASLQQRAESSEYWLGAALRHIEHLEDTQTNYWSGADWDRAPATNPPENYTTSLEGLAEHTRLTLEDLLNDEDEKLTQEEREWLDEQIRLTQELPDEPEEGECSCDDECHACWTSEISDCESMPELVEGDEEWLPEDEEDSDEDSDEDTENDDDYSALEEAIERGHIVTRQASDGGPDRKRARMGPLYQVGDVCHDENGTAYVWIGHSWAEVEHDEAEPMEIDSEEEPDEDVDALTAQFERLNLGEDENNTKERLAFTHQMCDNC